MDYPLRGIGQRWVAGTRTVLTAPGSNNTKGDWIEIVTSLSIDAAGIVVSPLLGTTSRTTLIDIGVGASGSEVAVIKDLFATCATDVTMCYWYLPLNFPQNTRISARYQSNAAVTNTLSTWFYDQGSLPSPGYGRITTFGATTTDSGGIAITPGASNSKGNYAVISASTPHDIHELAVAFGNSGGDYTVASTAFVTIDIAVGPANEERVIIPDLITISSAASDTYTNKSWPTFPINIPAGSRIAVRAQSSIASPELIDVVLYGLG